MSKVSESTNGTVRGVVGFWGRLVLEKRDGEVYRREELMVGSF